METGSNQVQHLTLPFLFRLRLHVAPLISLVPLETHTGEITLMETVNERLERSSWERHI